VSCFWFRFNPDAGPYGFGTFPGHLARNPYNESKVERYTGRIKGKDYLRDIQLAHMRTLAHTYGTEIMVC
jgi:alpha-L-fucosidase